jgi:Tfp pilus assembly protein PilO
VFFHFLRFHVVRLYRAQPLVVLMLLAASIALAASAVVYAEQRHEAQQARADLQRLRSAVDVMKDQEQDSKPEATPAMELPTFDNVALVQALNSIAAETQLPLDEVAYSLDESSSEPYLRYRITLRVAGNYRAIRTFSDRFTLDMLNVSLDAINCARQDVSTVPLTCDLAFSAFYRRRLRG